ncbi:hypothetical protein OAB13_01685 [Salibacteraceae bacterium]|nr:hypothetical protein [Salibacteraceae bacterium]
MRNTSLFGIFIIGVFILASCKPSADVASNGWFQKRKYRKGFHFDIAKKKKLEDTFVLSAKTPNRGPSENINNEVVQKQQVFKKPKLLIMKYFSRPKEESFEAIILGKSENKTQESSIIVDKEEPSDREKIRKNLIRFWAWFGSFLLLLTSLLLGALVFIDFPFLVVIIGIFFLPIPIVLSALYLVEHIALSRGRSIFSEERMVKLNIWSKRSVRLLALFSLLSIIIFLVGILLFISMKYILLWAIMVLIIGSLYLMAYWSAMVLNILTHSGNFVDTFRLLTILFSPVLVAGVTVMLAFILGFLSALF